MILDVTKFYKVLNASIPDHFSLVQILIKTVCAYVLHYVGTYKFPKDWRGY